MIHPKLKWEVEWRNNTRNWLREYFRTRKAADSFARALEKDSNNRFVGVTKRNPND